MIWYTGYNVRDKYIIYEEPTEYMVSFKLAVGFIISKNDKHKTNKIYVKCHLTCHLSKTDSGCQMAKPEI
jgi:hypothetical protein